MKILLVTDAWRPQVNGVVTCYERIIPLLEKRGHEITIIHPGLFKTMRLFFYPEIQLSLFPKRKLRHMIERVQPDAVHIAVNGPLGLAARAICKEKNIPFTTCYHTNFATYLTARGLGFLESFAYALLRKFHNSGARTMVATESLKQELERHGFTNLVLWPLGVDTELFVRNPSPALPPLPSPVFVYFGRVAIEKSLDEFLDSNLPGTKLIIGDGPDRARLEKKYAGKARFVGYKKGKELVEWLSICDVFVFPSRTDTFGLVIVEALASGLPVAAHDCMGPRDIITEGLDGYLSENLEEAAKKCLDLDREACRKKALSYSWERSAGAFEESLALVRDKRNIQ